MQPRRESLILMRTTIRGITFAILFAGLVQAQVPDVAGEWQVARRPLSAPVTSPPRRVA